MIVRLKIATKNHMITNVNDLPLPAAHLQAQSDALSVEIRQEMNQTGAMSFARFMELALYHPKWGYYTNPYAAIGKSGDFTTAPLLSPLFADCIAQQVAQVLQHLEGGGDILEIGAGTGQLAADLLLALDEANTLPNHYFIHEISPSLRKQQQVHLKQAVPHLYSRILWVDTLPAALSGVIIANEVLDALPVHCFQISAAGELEERCVIADQQGFAWQPAPASPALKKLIDEYELPLYPLYQSEVSLALPLFVQSLASSLARGLILIADYGYGRREYYHPERKSGTLTCFYEHRKHDNPLILIGLQDITAHVDFTAVIEKATAAGCSLGGYTTQTGFLLGCGFLEAMAKREATLSQTEVFTLRQAAKTLTLPTEMGEVVKIMGLTKALDLPLLGFSLQSRTRDL